MMEGLPFLITDLALILAVAGITTLIFKKINQPVVLGYLVAGFLTSPHFIWLPTVTDPSSIKVWGDIGIIFLMFALGLEFSFHKIAKVGGSAIITAITVMSAMLLIGISVGTLMGWSQMDSMFLGGMISMSSTMIILKAYDELKLKRENFASLVLGTLVIEDIAGIFMMVILTTLSVSRETSGIEMVGNIGFLLVMLVMMLAGGIYLVPSLLKRADKLLNDENLLIFSIAFCLVMVVLSVLIGFSSALGAFLAGSILAGTVYAGRIEKLMQPIKDLFGAVFFVSVGMMVVPDMLVTYIVPILIITAVTISGQMVFSAVGVLLAGQSPHTAVRAGFSMVQIGEFSFILANLGDTLGVTSNFLYPIVVCVSVITTFTTPIFIKSGEGAYAFIMRVLPDRVAEGFSRYTSEKQSDTDKDADWKQYLTKTFIRILVCFSSMFMIYLAGTKILPGIVTQWIPGIWSKILIPAIMLIAMAPFISLMYSRKRVLFTKLWIKNSSNRLPLLFFNTVKVLISVMFVMFTIAHFSPLPFWGAFLIGTAVVAVIERSDFMRGASINIEIRFVTNFNEKILEKAKAQRKGAPHNWIDERLFVVEFGVKEPGKTAILKNMSARKVFGVIIIKIIRDGVHMNLPEADAEIKAGDRLVAVGTKTQIEAYIMRLKSSKYINDPEEPMCTLREYMYAQIFHEIPPEEQVLCCAVPVEKGSDLVKMPIRASHFTSDYKGIIVGIERGLLPIIQPDRNVIITEGDILWVLGNQNTFSRLLKEGFLEG